MSKYTEEQLQSIAIDALQAHAVCDVRFETCLMMLSACTGISMDECMARIRRIAETGEA